MIKDPTVDKMLAAASSAKSHEEAVWSALKVLENEGGYICLPGFGGSAWRPDIHNMARRYLRIKVPCDS